MAGDAQSAPDAGSGGSFLPPVFTHWSGSEPETASSSDPVALPFLPEGETSIEQASAVPDQRSTTPESTGGPEVAAPVESAPIPEPAPAEAFGGVDFAEADDDDAGDDAEAFPIDAFIIPDDSERMPAGVGSGTAAQPETISNAPRSATLDRAQRLADRLEALAHRLRAQGPAALGTGLESGDRFDAVLTGLLAGYLAAGDE